MFKKGKSREREGRLLIAWSCGWEPRVNANRHEISFGGDWSILNLDHRDDCTGLQIY